MTPERLNAWRVVPRLMVIGFALVVWDVGQWFMTLPEPTMIQSAFASTVYGAIPFVINFYCGNGK
jgi:hypothetical protein